MPNRPCPLGHVLDDRVAETGACIDADGPEAGRALSVARLGTEVPAAIATTPPAIAGGSLPGSRIRAAAVLARQRPHGGLSRADRDDDNASGPTADRGAARR